MVRPTRQDRESIALIHVRISLRTKTLLDRLRIGGGYKTTDEALLDLLQSMQTQTQSQSTKQMQRQSLTITRDMLQRPDTNKLISSASKEIYHKYVSPGQRQHLDEDSSITKTKTKTKTKTRASHRHHHF